MTDKQGKPLEAFLLDKKTIAEYCPDADRSIKIEDVRKALSKIKGKIGGSDEES